MAKNEEQPQEQAVEMTEEVQSAENNLSTLEKIRQQAKELLSSEAESEFLHFLRQQSACPSPREAKHLQRSAQ